MTVIPFGQACRPGNGAAEAPAVTDAQGTLTRFAFDRLSDAAAYRLADLGISYGDFVAITGNNSARFLAASFGIWKLGAVPLVIPASRTPEEMFALLRLGKPKLAIGFPPMAVPGIEQVTLEDVFLADASGRPMLPEILPPHLRVGASGGSTGAPKLIVVESPAAADPDRPWPFGMRPDGTHVMPLNLTDGTGFVMSAMSVVSRCHLVLMPEFDAETLLALIERHRADWVPVTPPVMLAVWKLGAQTRAKYDLSALRAVSQYSGAAANWLKRAWIDWLGPSTILETYGATESRGSTVIDGHEWLAHPGSVGRAAPGCEVAILDVAGKPLPPGEIGEIYFRDLTGMRKFRLIGAALATLPGGWETVGDMGWCDAESFLYISDRRKDMIKTSDGIVFPLEVEGALERHDAVRSALVFGLPAARGLERIHAMVDAPGGIADIAGLKQFLAALLPPHKIPSDIELCSGPLRDLAGKGRRQQLRAERIALARANEDR
jgi:bile acid-coenzyme A ligase